MMNAKQPSSINAKRSKLKRREYGWGYAMVFPLLFGISALFIWPVLRTIYLSFTEWSDFGNYHWRGLSNYIRLIRDTAVYHSLLHTLQYVIIYVPAIVILSTLAGVLLSSKVRGISVYRTIFFLPSVLMPAAIAMSWKWILNGDYGLLNAGLKLLSIHGVSWLTDSRTVLISVVGVAVWGAVGLQAVIIISGIKGISPMLYEAASIEGAGRVSRFFRITLPLITPTLFFVSVTSLIGAMQVFDLIYMMVGTVAIDHVNTVVYLFYQQAFIKNDKGYASSIAVLLFIIILIVTALQFKLQKKWVHYD